MPKPRKAQVSLEATPYYHCTSRCVRRAFLCGTDQHSGQNYEHRRQWIESRMRTLAEVFAVDVCAYAVMSNHYHVIVHIAQERAEAWNKTEVLHRWHRLFAGHTLSRRCLAGEPLSAAERGVVSELAQLWRSRLRNISWYMRCLNEAIARRANDEDQCTGRFWEGRFTSQALLDEKALAACMAYVDLNPIRAGMADTPETSAHTSIRVRIAATQSASDPDASQPPHLMPFVGPLREPMPEGLPFRLADYLELVDWTGRAIRDDKRGMIPDGIPPILERLQIEPRYWLYMAKHFESRFKGIVGAAYKLKAACAKLGYRRTPNLAVCNELLS